MAHKNDYTCVIFFSWRKPTKTEYVHNLLNYAKWLENSQYADYLYFNIYDRRTCKYLKRHYRGNFIAPFI